MAATTPPPAKRIRTPPTPLHGPKYDSRELLSPLRRSSRISSKTSSSPLDNSDMPTGAGSHGAPMRNNPQSVRKPTFRRTSSQHFSPPSSPASPSKSSTPARRQLGSNRAAPVRQEAKTVISSSNLLDSHNPLRKSATKPDLSHTLPTPTKTPRKRNHPAESQLKDTARILFPSRPQNDDDIMPPRRRRRKGLKYAPLPLDDLAPEPSSANDIAIYTDSKERVPEIDRSEENPFYAPDYRPSEVQREEVGPSQLRPNTKYGMSEEIDRRVDNGEGLVYVFRGKKVFRRFDEEDPASDEDESQSKSTRRVMHRAGAASHRSFTRASIKPRRLFVAEPGPNDVDEEAPTDIEAAPSASGRKRDAPQTPEAAEEDGRSDSPPSGHSSSIGHRKRTKRERAAA